MRPRCPICHAEHCPETRPDCRARGEQIRALYAAANGSPEPEPVQGRADVRAEVRRLRAEVARLRRGGAR